MLKIQSVRRNLDAIDDTRLPNAEEIDECLETADESLREALGYRGGPEEKPEGK
jgi:hypothetical protein